MVEYIGTKRIQAEPMTRGEYASRSGRHSILPAEAESDEGYIVRYDDGYISWSPKAQFEAAYRSVDVCPLVETALLMQSSDYKERFLAEYQQLEIRINRLHNMLAGWDKGTLSFEPVCPKSTYNAQLQAMRSYLKVLQHRASEEHIELKGE